jgi:hypothetical protein
MRSLSVSASNLTWHIKNELDDINNIAKSEGVLVRTYKDLVKEIAELSYLNPDFMLFFRGQAIDYKNKSSSTTLYPSIYREERLTKDELKYKLDVLSAASSLLVDKLEKQRIIGKLELKRKKQLQWSILQHYEVSPTPLLDITHSLRVACSFSALNNPNEFSYVYILALPYITGRISINSEYDLINIRLLSISPPQALRPFFQEGYLVGTEYICDEYENKAELDFNRRLLAKYKIPNSESFWGRSFNKIDESLLYPKSDIMFDICNEIKEELDYKVAAGNETIGGFLFKWNSLENILRTLNGGQYNTNQGLKYLKYNSELTDINFNKLDEIRKFRNKVVHEPNSITLNGLHQYDSMLESLLTTIEEIASSKNRR